jgi:hypothetical protein
VPTWIGEIDRVVLGIRISVLRSGVGERPGVRVAVDEAPGSGVVVVRVSNTSPIIVFYNGGGGEGVNQANLSFVMAI